MRCPLCQSRPAKRHCPALDRVVCPACCGSKRRTEIRCTDTCVFLANAQSHPPAVVQREQGRDVAILWPGLQGLSNAQQQLFFLTLSLVVQFKGEELALDQATDADVTDAAGALAATFETSAKGLIYEQSAASVPARRLADGIRQAYDELGSRQPSSFAVDAARVLRRIGERVDEAHRAGLDARHGFIDLADRITARLGPMEDREPKLAGD
jgi:hypothetical protein